MTEAEKELVFSKTMTSTVEGKYIRDIVDEYLQSEGYKGGFKRQKTKRKQTSKLSRSQSNMNATKSQIAEQKADASRVSLYEQEIRRVREESFQKLKKALRYTEQE